MVEVFRTNVQHSYFAHLLISEIHERFPDYSASFDLQDCDKVLRIESANGAISKESIINMVNGLGFCAEVLPDIIPAPSNETQC